MGTPPQDNLTELLRQVPALLTELTSLWKLRGEENALGPDIKARRSLGFQYLPLAPCAGQSLIQLVQGCRTFLVFTVHKSLLQLH